MLLNYSLYFAIVQHWLTQKRRKISKNWLFSCSVNSANEVNVYANAGHVTVATGCFYRPCSYSLKTTFCKNILHLMGRRRLADNKEQAKIAVIPMTGREEVTISALSTVKKSSPVLHHCLWDDDGNEKQKGSPSCFF